MNRKDIRYLMFRLKTEVEGGNIAPELPKGFKKTFETQKKFQGWLSFGVTWDVGGRVLTEENPNADTTSDENSFWTIVLRNESLDEAWNKVLEKVVVEIPKELLVET